MINEAQREALQARRKTLKARIRDLTAEDRAAADAAGVAVVRGADTSQLDARRARLRTELENLHLGVIFLDVGLGVYDGAELPLELLLGIDLNTMT